VSLPRPRRELLLPLLLFVAVALLVAACSPSGITPVGSGGVAATASPHPPLTPAQPGADPVSLLAWVFNPIFQLLYILLVWLQKVTGDVGVAMSVERLAALGRGERAQRRFESRMRSQQRKKMVFVAALCAHERGEPRLVAPRPGRQVGDHGQ